MPYCSRHSKPGEAPIYYSEAFGQCPVCSPRVQAANARRLQLDLSTLPRGGDRPVRSSVAMASRMLNLGDAGLRAKVLE